LPNDATGKLDACSILMTNVACAWHVGLHRSDCRQHDRNPDGDESLMVHRWTGATSFQFSTGKSAGRSTAEKESPHAEESQLQRITTEFWNFLRLPYARSIHLDAVGHANCGKRASPGRHMARAWGLHGRASATGISGRHFQTNRQPAAKTKKASRGPEREPLSSPREASFAPSSIRVSSGEIHGEQTRRKSRDEVRTLTRFATTQFHPGTSRAVG